MTLTSLLIATKLLLCLAILPLSTVHPAGDDGKLWVIALDEHSNDAQHTSGGTAARWAKLRQHMESGAVINSAISHWQSAGGPLAQPRLAEVNEKEPGFPTKRCPAKPYGPA